MGKKLTELYEKFTPRSFSAVSILDSIPHGKKEYKSQIMDFFAAAIRNSDSKKLNFCIGASFRDGIDSDYADFFEKVILSDWHEEHEDIVDLIYQFEDDRFSHALREIAMNKSKYRKYDDEHESTLRKCIHALKAIDSSKSNEILEELKKIDNPNIKFVLEM